MDLSKAVGTVAIVLGVVIAAGFAVGEDKIPVPVPAQKSAQVQKRDSMEEHQRRKEHFQRACGKTMKTDLDRETCRAAYRAL